MDVIICRIIEKIKIHFIPSNKPEKFHDDIVRLKVEGNSYKQVARKLGISYSRLYRYCKKKGI